MVFSTNFATRLHFCADFLEESDDIHNHVINYNHSAYVSPKTYVVTSKILIPALLRNRVA